MNTDLNLLPSQAKFQAAKIKLQKRVKIFLWILISVWFFFLLIVLSLWFVIQTKLTMVDKKNKTVLNQYQTMGKDIIISQQIKYQAKLVGKVLSERFEYGKTIEKINGFFSPNIVLEKSELSGKDKFDLGGKIIDGKYLSEIEDKIIEVKNNKSPDFSSAKLTSLAVDKDNIWTFEMEVEIK